MKPEILKTADGSHTLYLEQIGEQYHSMNGAITESMHVFINNGFHFHSKSALTVFEVGFGTGLNCLLTALEAEKHKIPTTYISVEKYPLNFEIIEKLNYTSIIGSESTKIWERIHKSEWNKSVSIGNYFTLHKKQIDITKDKLIDLPKFDIIYFDAFGPDIQPEIWSTEIFHELFLLSTPQALLTTYSAKGIVRRRLSSVGFQMEKIPGPPGKKEMLRGIKN